MFPKNVLFFGSGRTIYTSLCNIAHCGEFVGNVTIVTRSPIEEAKTRLRGAFNLDRVYFVDCAPLAELAEADIIHVGYTSGDTLPILELLAASALKSTCVLLLEKPCHRRAVDLVAQLKAKGVLVLLNTPQTFRGGIYGEVREMLGDGGSLVVDQIHYRVPPGRTGESPLTNLLPHAVSMLQAIAPEKPLTVTSPHSYKSTDTKIVLLHGGEEVHVVCKHQANVVIALHGRILNESGELVAGFSADFVASRVVWGGEDGQTTTTITHDDIASARRSFWRALLGRNILGSTAPVTAETLLGLFEQMGVLAP
jgi:hypothetical protein